MKSADEDIQVFETVLQDLFKHFQQHPFHYGNENPVIPELYGRLRNSLEPETIPVEYRQDHSNPDDWRNREFFERVDSGEHHIPRVRPEIRFYKDGIWGGAKTDFDIAIFPDGQSVVMQGKKEGIGNFIDVTETEIAVLCEIKHSMNMSGRFRSGGATDITALAEYPGRVGRRYFVFLDWWPRDGYGNHTYQRDIEQLTERLDQLDSRVDIAYLPREGDSQFTRGIGSDRHPI